MDRDLLIDDLIATRRSVRRYRAEPISTRLVDALLEAAVAAPSPHNRQPWRFVVIEAPATKAALAQAMGTRLRFDRLRDGDAAETVEADVARSYARLTGAPVLVLVCVCTTDMDRYPDEQRMQAEHTMAMQAAAMAAQNILLAAHANRLGACWMCAPLFCAEVVAATLALPADWQPQALITLGFPADAGKPHRRRALAEVTRYQDRRS